MRDKRKSSHIKITFKTTRDISGINDGETLFRILKDFGFHPDRVGHYEPLRQPFETDNFYFIQNLWMAKENPRSRLMSQLILATGKQPVSFNLSVGWMKNIQSGRKWFNHLSLWFSDKWLQPNLESVLALGRSLYIWARAEYGSIGTWDAWENQCKQGTTLADLLPGVSWANFFGPVYMAAIGEAQLESVGVRTERLSDGGIIVFTCDDPFDPCLEDPDSKLVRKFKQQVGVEWFGEAEENRVPTFDFSELRDPLEELETKLSTEKEGTTKEKQEPPPLQPEIWQNELEATLGRSLGFVPEELSELDALMRKCKFKPKDAIPLGWYLGEIVRQQKGGEWAWNDEFHTWSINGIGNSELAVFPFAKVNKLFMEKQREGFTFFYQVLTKEWIKKSERKKQLENGHGVFKKKH